MLEKTLYKIITEVIDKRVKENLHREGVVIPRSGGQVSGASQPTQAPLSTQQQSIQQIQSIVQDLRTIPDSIVRGFDVIATRRPSTKVIITNKRGSGGDFISEGFVNGNRVSMNGAMEIELSGYMGSERTLWISFDRNGYSISDAKEADKLALARIIIKPESVAIRDDFTQSSLDGYIITAKDFMFDGRFEIDDESIPELKKAIQKIFAEYIFGTITLSDRLKIQNELGTIQILSNAIEMYTMEGKVVTKWNKDGIFFFDKDENQIAAFGPRGNYVSAFDILDKNTLVIKDENENIRQKYGKLSSGDWGIEHWNKNSKKIYKLGNRYSWYKGKYISSKALMISEHQKIINEFDDNESLSEQLSYLIVNYPLDIGVTEGLETIYSGISDSNYVYVFGLGDDASSYTVIKFDIEQAKWVKRLDGLDANLPLTCIEQDANYLYVGTSRSGINNPLIIYKIAKSDLSVVSSFNFMNLPLGGTYKINKIIQWGEYLYATANQSSSGNYYWIRKIDKNTGDVTIARDYTTDGMNDSDPTVDGISATDIGFAYPYIFKDKLYLALGLRIYQGLGINPPYNRLYGHYVRFYSNLSLNDLILTSANKTDYAVGTTEVASTPQIKIGETLFSGIDFMILFYDAINSVWKMAQYSSSDFVTNTLEPVYQVETAAYLDTMGRYFYHDGSYLWNSYNLQLKAIPIFETTVTLNIYGNLAQLNPLISDNNYYWAIKNSSIARINL